MTTGIIFDIRRFSLRDGPGIRTTVFFKGCPLHCPWCHNPEARRNVPELAYYAHRCISCGVCARVCPNNAVQIKIGEPHILRDRCVICGKCAGSCVSGALVLTGERMTVEQVMAQVRKDRNHYDKTSGGLSISGGEPLQQIDFLVELLASARAEGIHTCVETNGFDAQEDFERILPFTNLLLFDYKATGPEYASLIGVEESVILDNLDFLYRRTHNIILRCPLVPGVNDSAEHLAAIAGLDRAYPDLLGIELLPFQNSYISKFELYGYTNPMPGLRAATGEDCYAWRSMLESFGAQRITVLT